MAWGTPQMHTRTGRKSCASRVSIWIDTQFCPRVLTCRNSRRMWPVGISDREPATENDELSRSIGPLSPDLRLTWEGKWLL